MSFDSNDLFVHEKVRKPAVAGTFYAADSSLLRTDIQKFLTSPPESPGTVRILISPHAGYVYSGSVAGKGFACIPRSVSRVIVLGPSHYHYFDGLGVSRAVYYETPLGRLSVDTGVIRELQNNAHLTILPIENDREHSIEVQLPFLQVLLGDIKIVPILVGNVAPQAVAEAILPHLDSNTLVVASSDLSHFLDQDLARATDNESIRTILLGATDGTMEACGEVPIRIVMHLGAMMGLRSVLIDARTSFESAPGQSSRNRVVGYASIAFVQNGVEGDGTGVGE